MERAMIRSRGRQRSSPRYQMAAGFASTYRGRAIRREKDKAIASPVRKRERAFPGPSTGRRSAVNREMAVEMPEDARETQSMYRGKTIW